MQTNKQLKDANTALQKENDKLVAEQHGSRAREYANSLLKTKNKELIEKVATQDRQILSLKADQKVQASRVKKLSKELEKLSKELEKALKAHHQVNQEVLEQKKMIANMDRFLDEIIAPP